MEASVIKSYIEKCCKITLNVSDIIGLLILSTDVDVQMN